MSEAAKMLARLMVTNNYNPRCATLRCLTDTSIQPHHSSPVLDVLKDASDSQAGCTVCLWSYTQQLQFTAFSELSSFEIMRKLFLGIRREVYM